MTLKLTSLTKAIESLAKSVQVISSPKQMEALTPEARETIQSGVIQNFEVAYEQAWKMMKRWIENNVGSTVVDGVSRRELFRLAAESQLIQDVDLWMSFHQARNETSHTYDGEIVEEVLEIASRFLLEVKNLYSYLEKHND
ncbi:MAG: nucleotidyltransferase substrate binding protein [Deltaproteobacteria bacterium]|nr:nucleotidyltransferase substrate binding protein [Deltaproteobacteria bacterium]